jgi:hypothetical protein
MDREQKSLPMLPVTGRADMVARNAKRSQRPSPRTRQEGVTARVVSPFLGLVLATLICPAPVFAGAFFANGQITQGFYTAPPPATPSVSPTHATFSDELKTTDVWLSSRADATSGHIKLFTLASINNTTNWASGGVRSTAAAAIVEPVAPKWELLATSIFKLTFDYELWVAGSLFTTHSGYGAETSFASLEYGYDVGDSRGSGWLYEQSDGRTIERGTWNDFIKSSFTVLNGLTFDLNLSADAAANGSKFYNANNDAIKVTSAASADFSHTMTWLGITGVHAFDSQGNEIALPSDFRIPLIGRESGIDYWYSAAATPASVPEPATMLLLGLGSLVATLMSKSAVRRRDS